MKRYKQISTFKRVIIGSKHNRSQKRGIAHIIVCNYDSLYYLVLSRFNIMYYIKLANEVFLSSDHSFFIYIRL
jgi:hypothetical protein